MYKVMNGCEPDYSKEMFLSSNTLQYNLRETLLIPNAKHDFMKKFFRLGGAVSWNKLSSFEKELRHMKL